MSGAEKFRVIRFGNFEVDLQSGELRHKGLKVKLQGQPFQILATLLERPGEVVTREELRLKLWPADTFVDFDHSLNAAIKRLRDALRDSAETPVFIETIARRGYRFLGNIEIAAASQPNAPELRSPTSTPYSAWSWKWQLGLAALAVVAIAGVVAGWFTWRSSARSLPQESPSLRRLTTNGTEHWVITSAISPDGKYLAYSDQTGAYFRVLSTGELHALLPKVPDAASLGWFPDSSQLLASWASPPGKEGLWALSILGGNPKQLSDEGWSASVSPDGQQIVFLKGADFADLGHEIWVMRANGADQRKLVSLPEGNLAYPVWSPDSHWIAYLKSEPGSDWEIELFNLENDTKKIILSDPRLEGWALAWLPDGRLVYAMNEPPPSENSSNLWVARVDLSKGRFVGTAARITSGDGFAVKPSVTADGKQLVFSRTKPHGNVFISEFSAKGPRLGALRQLTFDQGDDLPFDWTADNKAVLFISDRTGTPNIFRQPIDKASAEMLVVDEEKKSEICRLSPDGSQILYLVRANQNDYLGPARLMRALLSGGPSQVVLEAPAIGNLECSHAPASICAFNHENQQESVISVFDPENGDPHDVAKLQKETLGWGLSPDGKSIAAFTAGATNNQIRLFSLSGQPTRDITVKDWGGFSSLDWAADSKGLFVSSNPAGLRQSLLYVDLAGNAHEIWQVNHVWPSWAIPSRNGKYLAIRAPTIDSNVWMAENF